jgi:hypothetical protein
MAKLEWRERETGAGAPGAEAREAARKRLEAANPAALTTVAQLRAYVMDLATASGFAPARGDGPR